MICPKFCLKNHCSNPLIEDCTQVINGNTHDYFSKLQISSKYNNVILNVMNLATAL